MRENIIKAKFIGKTVLRKIVAISLVVSIGCFGANFCDNTQVSGGFFTKQTVVSAQSAQERELSQNDSDDFSCLLNFFCCIPIVFLTIFKIMADIAQGFSPSAKMGK